MYFYSTLKTTSVDQRAVHAIQNTQNRYKHYKYKIRIQYIKTSNKKNDETSENSLHKDCCEQQPPSVQTKRYRLKTKQKPGSFHFC